MPENSLKNNPSFGHKWACGCKIAVDEEGKFIIREICKGCQTEKVGTGDGLIWI